MGALIRTTTRTPVNAERAVTEIARRCTLPVMDAALVGLPAAGKTTVFNALTAGHGSAIGTEQIGVVKVPDDRLEKLAALVKAKKITPLELTLHDLPALFERGAAPSGPAAETLSRADALLHVVRAFERDDVPHPKGSVDPARDVAAFDDELTFNDLGIIERRLEKLDITVRSARPGEREAGEREKALLERCRALLNEGVRLRNSKLDPTDLKALGNFGLLSLKPMLIVLNISESGASNAATVEAEYSEGFAARGTGVTALSARLEGELAELPPDEAADFRREMGAGEDTTHAVLGKLLELLDLVTFFTIGELQAAGRVHTDIERGFIRAEVIAWDKLLELGSQTEARRHGQLRTEGKQYTVREGDVINVLFNV
jgi:ribosome-binding ATPase